MLTAPTNLDEERRELLLASRPNIKKYADTYPEFRDYCVAACYYEFPFFTFMEQIEELIRNRC